MNRLNLITSQLQPPVIVLVRPQLGQNIGAVARAMHNFAFTQLRIVAPRDGWPNAEADAMAAGAKALIESAQVYDDLQQALHDVHFSFGLTARTSSLDLPCFTPRAAAEASQSKQQFAQSCAFLLGCEANGLSREELSFCHAIITIPTQPEYASLNLAQAALLICYEYFLASQTIRAAQPSAAPASQDAQEQFLARLVALLENKHYFKSEQRKERSIQDLRCLFLRNQLSDDDINLLQGLISQLNSK